MRSIRRWGCVLLSLAFLLSCAGVGLGFSGREQPELSVLFFLILFGVMLGAWALSLSLPRRVALSWIGLLALGGRLLLVPAEPSDDLHRYLWEGKRVLEGHSPYAMVAAEAPEEWRDEHWQRMNHRERGTIYPPLTQYLFAGLVAIAYEPLVFKAAFLLTEALLLFLLAADLTRRRLPAGHLALAALNPLFLWTTGVEAHFDILFILALWLALSAVEQKASGRIGLFLAIAIQIKLVAVVVLPFLLTRLRLSGWLTLIVGIVVPSLPFLSDAGAFLEGVRTFGGESAHNGFVHAIWRWVVGETALASLISYGLLAVSLGWLVWRIREPWRIGFYSLGALILFSPIVHFWYLAWLVPFLVIRPQPAWLLLGGLQAFYFTVWLGEEWALPLWAWWLQWLPFAVVLYLDSRGAVRRLFAVRATLERPQRPAEPPTVSVVVPTLNVATRLGACLESLRQQEHAVAEIIVADGGSTDSTRTIAEESGARVIMTEPGRGGQIAAGCAQATGDIIWVVHADALAAPRCTSQIVGALLRNPDAVGGACGQRFPDDLGYLAPVTAANNLRAALLGISFGDQGQFFRRTVLEESGGFPKLPLMEDVELSLRLRRVGTVLFLGCPLTTSGRSWKSGAIWRRVRWILLANLRFLLSRDRATLSRKLFREYYTGP